MWAEITDISDFWFKMFEFAHTVLRRLDGLQSFFTSFTSLPSSFSPFTSTANPIHSHWLEKSSSSRQDSRNWCLWSKLTVSNSESYGGYDQDNYLYLICCSSNPHSRNLCLSIQLCSDNSGNFNKRQSLKRITERCKQQCKANTNLRQNELPMTLSLLNYWRDISLNKLSQWQWQKPLNNGLLSHICYFKTSIHLIWWKISAFLTFLLQFTHLF